ncbi:MAG: PAS domain S-box protein [Spirochaetales bacterium]|nr:PAS domain S-box protein [Spirochaetales bacterium]
MINLAQMKEKGRILSFYQDFLNRIFPEITASVIEEETPYPIATLNGSWGFLMIEGEEKLNETDHSLLCNSVSLLAIVLENSENYREISREADKARRIQERYFDLSPDLLCIADLDGYFVKLNRNWSALLGWTREELMARPWKEFVHPEDRMDTEEAKDYLALGKNVFSFENRYRSKSGEYYWLSWSSEYIPEEGYIFAVARNITRDRIVRDNKLQNDKLLALGQLAGGVAHDFNNQLTGIMGFAELAAAEISPDSPAREYLENIITSVSRSQNLTKQLLSYARKGSDDHRVIEMAVLVDEVCAILGRTTSRAVTISSRVDSAYSRMRGDPSQIQNMLLNLGINACDAMPEGGELVFETGAPTPSDLEQLRSIRGGMKGEYFCLMISDTGTGIPMAIQNKIFDPFFTTKPLQKGTGLGLSAVMGTVKGHSGYILLDSIPGQGTTFKLYFPVLSREEP